MMVLVKVKIQFTGRVKLRVRIRLRVVSVSFMSALCHDQHDKLSLSRVSPGQDKRDSHVNGQHQGHDEHKSMNVN